MPSKLGTIASSHGPLISFLYFWIKISQDGPRKVILMMATMYTIDIKVDMPRSNPTVSTNIRRVRPKCSSTENFLRWWRIMGNKANSSIAYDIKTNT